MTDSKVYKVGITAVGKYVHGTWYDTLTQVFYDEADGGDGCSYVSIKANKNVRPGTDSSIWVKASDRGVKGDIGPQGVQGPRGSQGPRGEQGIQGPRGYRGEQGPKGDQGNTGSSVDYPYELVNNRTTDDATKGLSAAEGKRLGDDIGKVDEQLNQFLTVAGEYLVLDEWQEGFYGGDGIFHAQSTNDVYGTEIDIEDYRGKVLLVHTNSVLDIYCGFLTDSDRIISNFQTEDCLASVIVPPTASTLFISNYSVGLDTEDVYVFFYDSYKGILPIQPENISGTLDGEPLELSFIDGGYYIQSGRTITFESSTGNSVVICEVEYGKEYAMDSPSDVPSSFYNRFFIFTDSSDNAVIDSGEIVDYVTPIGQQANGLYQYLIKIPSEDCVYLASAVSTARKEEIRVFEAHKKALNWLDLSYIENKIDNIAEEISSESKRIMLSDSIKKPIAFSGKRLVAFGDSITVGVTSPSYQITQNSYIKLFCDYAGVRTLDNRAVSATAISDDIYNRVLALTGDWDIIWIAGGTNDWNLGKPLGNWISSGSDTFYGALKGICGFLQTNYPNATVIFVTPIPYTRDASNWPNHITDLNNYRSAIYEVATYYWYNVVNGADLGMPKITGGWSNTMCADSDGCHPTERGHALYARNLTLKLL